MRGDCMELYKRIRQRREELGMTQDELANLMGYKSRSSINKIELGKSDIPQSKIKAFAIALRTTPEFLLGLSTEEQLIINRADELKDKAMLEIYYSHGYSQYKLLSIYNQLPTEQQYSLIDNAEFLAKRYIGKDFHIKTEKEVEKYCEATIFNTISIEDIEKSSEYKDYLEYEQELNAAHANNNSTPEENKHDDDIMDNDDEWK